MKINGFKLQLVLKQLNSNRDLLVTEFSDSLFAFENEKKQPPFEVFGRYKKLEENIAKVQTAQLQFNLSTETEVMGETMSLAEAVKRVGGATRMEKMLRNLVKKEDTPRWARGSVDSKDMVRDKDKVYAEVILTREEVYAQIRQQSQYTSALREAIQSGNGKSCELDILGLTASCLE